MTRVRLFPISATALVAGSTIAFAQDAKLERGKYLQTGKNPRGGKAGPPMPACKLKAEDADAITAYLKSLP